MWGEIVTSFPNALMGLGGQRLQHRAMKQGWGAQKRVKATHDLSQDSPMALPTLHQSGTQTRSCSARASAAGEGRTCLVLPVQGSGTF